MKAYPVKIMNLEGQEIEGTLVRPKIVTLKSAGTCAACGGPLKRGLLARHVARGKVTHFGSCPTDNRSWA